MKYLHTMVRVSNLEDSLHFYCELLGLQEVRRRDSVNGRFTLVFLATSQEAEAQINSLTIGIPKCILEVETLATLLLLLMISMTPVLVYRRAG